MKTLIVGDIHNEFAYLNDLINKKQPDLLICCGEFGYWPNIPWAAQFTNIKPQNSKILWCEGNHEDFWSLQRRETDELVPNVIYMPRGSTYTLPDGRVIMFFGGANSIDKNIRTLGVDWFPEEVITQKDLYNLPDIKVDIFITHTCSLEIKNIIIPRDHLKENDPSYNALSELWNIYRPSLWYFAHFHFCKTGYQGDTKWTCLGAAGMDTKWWVWLPD